MPRALIISADDLYLQPLKALFDSNKVTYIDIVNHVSGAEKIRISQMLAGTDSKYDCVFINGAECQQIIQDTDIEHCFAVYSLPETYLLSKTINDTDSVAQLVAEWQQQLSSCLQAIEKSEVINLVSLDDVLTNSSNFLKEIFDKEENSREIVETDIASQLLDIGIKASLVDRDDLYELYDALLSRSRIFGSFSVHLSPDVQIFKNEAHSLIEIAKAFNDKSRKVAQLKSQLEELSTSSNKLSEELSEQLQIAESALKEKQVLAKELVKLKENTADELKQAELDAFQIQEELEATFSELQKIKTSQEQQNKEASAREAELQAKLLKNKNDWNKKLTTIESEKEKLLKEFKSAEQHSAEKLNKAELNTLQLKEELEASFSELKKIKASQEKQKQEAAKKVAELQSELAKKNKEWSSKFQKIEEEKEKLLKEFKSVEQHSAEKLNKAELHTLQLKEELEASFSELKKIKASQEKQKQEAAKKVAELQSELAKKNKEWFSKFQKVEEEKEKLLKELKGVEQHKAEELKRCEQQTFQLQEELEVTFLELETLKNKTHTLTDGEDLDAFVSAIKSEKLLLEEQISLLEKDLVQQQANLSEAKVNQVKEELELATLQITQLQEELEFYYLQAVEESKLKGMDVQKTIIGKSFESVSADSLKIVGQYVEGDYRDLHLVLENANFPHCGIVDTLNVKLVNVSGKTGIEFRTEGNPDNLFNVHDDCKDEYGAYLRYFPDAPEFISAQQEKIKQRLNASERLLALCTLNCIQRALVEGCLTNDAGVDDATVKDWKLSLADLEFRKYYPIDWLSFDGVTIKECFAMDGYEHLWLQFNNLLAGDVLRRKMDVKLCAKNLTEKGGQFLASFFLEFRVNSDGTEPLYAWPPETSDEYGPKLEVGLSAELDNLILTKEDTRLISLIRDNIQSILVKCDTSQSTLKHSINAWCNAIENSLEIANEAELIEGSAEGEDVVFKPVAEQLSVEEVVDLDSYQHIVFSTEESQLKIKLRAENINKETFDAELYLEFRDGTPDVIYNSTEFFDVDDYGPRVKIPAEILAPLADNSEYSGEFHWAAACYNALISLIESSNEVDDLLKIMWAKVLERKKQ